MWFWLAACSSPPVAPAVRFVRDGLVVSTAGPGHLLQDGATLLERPWTPGEPIDLDGVQGVRPTSSVQVTAPMLAECLPVWSLSLGGSDALARGDGPDTALAFSPDGSRLAIGTVLGDVWVVDAWTGAVGARRHLAETLVREVAWAEDGRTLYAAEQSPDALVHALDPASLASIARWRLADDVGTSPLPPASDLYGVYTLPSAYALRVLPGGDLLVAASHGWDTPDGRRNASRLLRLRREGDRFAVVAAWPENGPADAVFGALATGGDRVAVAVRRSADGPAPAELLIDGVQLLDPELAATGVERFSALAPHYRSTFVWDALAVTPDGLVAGFGDGRLVAREGGGEWLEALGTPVLAGDVPIAASIGFLRTVGDRLFVVTSRTAIPYGAAAPELRPPFAHPNENTLWSYRQTGGSWTRDWSWRGAPLLAGLAVSPDGDELAVGAGPREGDDRRDQFGAVVFRVDGTGEPSAFCATAGPAYHRLALAADGRVAVAEVPWLAGDVVQGEYRVTVLR